MPATPVIRELPTDPQNDMVSYINDRNAGKEVSEVKAEETPAESASAPESEKPDGEEPEIAAESETANDAEKQKIGEKGKGKDKRFDKLTKRNYDLANERDTERKARIAAEEKLAAFEGKKTSEKPVDAGVVTGKPKAEDFASYEDFVEALADYKADLREKKAAEEQAKAVREVQDRTESERAKAVLDAHIERIAQAREDHDDFDEVLESAVIPLPENSQRAKVFQEMFDLGIQECEHGAEVLYYLAKNPEKAAQLKDLDSSVKLIARIERIAAAIAPDDPESPAPPAKKAVSGAPTPIKPVGAAGTKTNVNDDNIPMSEYVAKKNAAERKRSG